MGVLENLTVNDETAAKTVRVVKERNRRQLSEGVDLATMWLGDTEKLLASLPKAPQFDLVVTSPPYNIGKEYEAKSSLDSYMEWQERIIDAIVPRLADTGSICWQVGNYVNNGHIIPLDIEFAPIFKKHGLKLRNRIIWHFGHGLHSKKRFSGRYEVIMWYSKSDDYYFDLDAVRVPSKYPGKRHFKGPKRGQISGNPLGKNPEDVWSHTGEEQFGDFWSIPNVKSNHIEKTSHPCQFPVGLIERLVLSMCPPSGLVFDPFSGVGSSGVAALLHDRRFLGSELSPEYMEIALQRLNDTLAGRAKYRPHDKPLYDHRKSNLSKVPEGDE